MPRHTEQVDLKSPATTVALLKMNAVVGLQATVGVDGSYAARTASKAYRTTPLRALWQRPPYFHNGSAATLADVVAHYNRVRKLDLTADQQRGLA